jgi:ABC-type glycerol-3-phosphate transport system substrate-binding protein
MKLESLLIPFFFLAICQSCTLDQTTGTTGQSAKVHSVQLATKQLNLVGHWLHEGRRENLIRDLANEYEFLNQDCKVNMVFPENIYWDRSKKDCELEFIAKVITSDKPEWDVIRKINDNSEQVEYMKDPFWAKRYLVDFSVMQEYRDNTIPELLTDSIKQQWQGIIPGPFLEGFNWAIWYDQAFARELGLNIKQFGMTFDDLLGYVKTISEYNKSHNTSIIPIQDCTDWSTRNVITQMLYLSEMGNLAECRKDNYSERKLAALKKALQAQEELSKYHAFPETSQNLIWNKTQDYPMKRKSFFYVNATWMYNIWQMIDSSEVNNMIPAELPVFKPMDFYFGGYFVTWAVPKNAPHKEEGIKFLLFMNRPDVADKWSRITKCPTGIKGNMTSAILGTDHFEEFTSYIQKKYGLRKAPWVDDASLIVGSSKARINLYSHEVSSGKMTADEALGAVRKELRIR